MLEFDLVFRGYDRLAVDRLVAAIAAAHGDRTRIDAAIAAHGALPVVLRGYERAQVDAWLAGCRTGGPSGWPPPSSEERPRADNA